MRRSVGAAQILQKKNEQEKYEAAGKELKEIKLSEAEAQFEFFSEKLKEFALKHAKRINENAEFRQKFHEMCNSLGIDPLISNKSVWAKYLGVGNFYAKLGVQVLTVCMVTRSLNGGILDMNECVKRVNFIRGEGKIVAEVSANDIERAIKKLSVLGSGAISLLKSASGTLILSIPEELNTDQIVCIQAAQKTGFLTIEEMKNRFGWVDIRCKAVFDFFLQEGIVWVDEQYVINGRIEIAYWFPSIAMELKRLN